MPEPHAELRAQIRRDAQWIETGFLVLAMLFLWPFAVIGVLMGPTPAYMHTRRRFSRR